MAWPCLGFFVSNGSVVLATFHIFAHSVHRRNFQICGLKITPFESVIQMYSSVTLLLICSLVNIVHLLQLFSFTLGIFLYLCVSGLPLVWALWAIPCVPGSPLATAEPPASCALTPTWVGQGEKTGMRKLVGLDEDRDITYQLPSRGKQTWFGDNEFNLWPNKKNI